MNANDKNKDFIDEFFDKFEPYQDSEVRFLLVVIGFVLLFIVGLIAAPVFVKTCISSFGIDLKLLQLAPYETFFNYLKIAFCFSSFFISPIAIYQFGKLKMEKLDFDSRINLLIAASFFLLITLLSGFLTFKFILPFEIFFFFGLGYNLTQNTLSISSLVACFLITMLLTMLIILLPFMRFIIKKSLFFNYATLIKFQKPVLVYSAILSAILILPCEFIILGMLFVLFVMWYKILVNFSKKRD